MKKPVLLRDTDDDNLIVYLIMWFFVLENEEVIFTSENSDKLLSQAGFEGVFNEYAADMPGSLEKLLSEDNFNLSADIPDDRVRHSPGDDDNLNHDHDSGHHDTDSGGDSLDDGSSPLTQQSAPDKSITDALLLEKRGGIDFTGRAMRIKLERMGSFKDLSLVLPKVSNVEDINLDSEFTQIQSVIQTGIIPNSRRLLEFIAACYYRQELQDRLPEIISCLAEACKIEELNAVESKEDLRTALMMPDMLYAYGASASLN